jgi:transposase
VCARGSRPMELPGIGPAGAARILADVGDVARFPTKALRVLDRRRPDRRLLRRAGAPPAVRGRNRRLNHVLHIAAVVRLRNDTPGRASSGASTSRERAAWKPSAA